MSTQAAMRKARVFRKAGVIRTLRSRRTFLLEFTVVFAAVALVLVFAAGFILTRFLAADIRDTSIADLESEAAEVTAPIIARNLEPPMLDGPLAGAPLAEFDELVRQGLLSSRTLRINVYNSEGNLVYTSAGSVDESERVAPSGSLQGDVVSRVGAPSSFSEPGLASYDELVRLAVPLAFAGSAGETAGVVEVYRDFTPVADHIASIQTSVYIGIGAALAVLYLALVIFVRRGSNTIRRHQADLETRIAEMKTGYEAIIAVMGAALDLRDNVTHGHAERVAELASVLAWQLGMRKEQLRQIQKAATLHDIGKIGVADAVLSKAGPLDSSEWEEMKRHPELGQRIVREIDFLKDAAEVLHAHHEWFDGSGYPRGLKGEDIPLGARVFAVVDAYEAMTSHRPYRQAISHKKAVEEIVRNAKSQFDPDVVRAFLEAEQRGLLDVRRTHAKSENGPEPFQPLAGSVSSATD